MGKLASNVQLHYLVYNVTLFQWKNVLKTYLSFNYLNPTNRIICSYSLFPASTRSTPVNYLKINITRWDKDSPEPLWVHRASNRVEKGSKVLLPREFRVQHDPGHRPKTLTDNQKRYLINLGPHQTCLRSYPANISIFIAPLWAHRASKLRFSSCVFFYRDELQVYRPALL